MQVIDAKTPNAMLTVESEDTRVDNRCVRLLYLHQGATSYVLFPPHQMSSNPVNASLTRRANPPPYRAIKDDRVGADGKIDTAELDEWLSHLDGAPGPATTAAGDEFSAGPSR